MADLRLDYCSGAVVTFDALQPQHGPIRGEHHVRATPENILWGYLPNAAATPILTVDAGATVTVDTLSHEGLLEDQGRDPITYFASDGVDRRGVLDDAVDIATSGIAHHNADDGPHIVTGPIAVRGARPGDVLKIDVLELALRAGTTRCRSSARWHNEVEVCTAFCPSPAARGASSSHSPRSWA